MPVKPKPIAERLWAKVEKTDGCWLWKGSVRKDGYGSISTGKHKANRLTHRVAWESFVGTVPPGRVLIHQCGNLTCVRPEHLILADMPTRTRRDPTERFWAKVQKGEGCWEWQGARDGKGYGAFLFATGDVRRAPRVAWELTHGPIPEGFHALHSCDNPPCVRPDHLFLGTPKDNMADMDAKGRRVNAQLKGERQVHAKLTEENVRELRRLYAVGGLRFVDLGRMFGVSAAVAHKVVRRQTWKHVE